MVLTEPEEDPGWGKTGNLRPKRIPIYVYASLVTKEFIYVKYPVTRNKTQKIDGRYLLKRVLKWRSNMNRNPKSGPRYIKE